MQRHSRTSIVEDLLSLATRLPWWMDLLLALFAYFGLHLWHIHLLQSINHINSSVPMPANANPLTALPHAVNAGLAHGIILFGSIATEIFQYLVPVLFVLGSIASVIREQKLKRTKRDRAW